VKNLSLPILFLSLALQAQVSPPAHSLSPALELPIALQQKIEAGKTQVGAKVTGKLLIATLVNGTVIPNGAVFTGEVLESVKKSGDTPSRLAIRMNSVKWKNGSSTFTVYLTSWYYPPRLLSTDNDGSDPSGISGSAEIGTGAGSRLPPSVGVSGGRFPPSDPSLFPDTAPGPPDSYISKHRVLMDGVHSEHKADGVVVLVSSKHNIKLDRAYTYVLASGDLLPEHRESHSK
jgi:hypothetical protein